MCIFGGTPKVNEPVMPQQAREPDGGLVAANMRRRTKDKVRAFTSTILTGKGGGVDMSPAATGGKQLFGQ